jgi:flagellar basal-body rod protein FlgF
MSGAKESLLSHGINNNNLANASTTGFRSDLAQFRSMPVFGPGHPSRVYAMTENVATNFKPGPIETTGRDLDIAVKNEGWIAIQSPDGTEAYTRAGNMRVTDGGLLVTGTGHPVLGNGGPIAIPPAESILIGDDGTVSIKPQGQGAAALATIDRIRLVNPDLAQMDKGEDGLVRMKDGGVAVPDANVQVMSGALERSNVNVVESMVKMIELSRHYEMQVKIMTTAEEVDQSSDRLLSAQG